MVKLCPKCGAVLSGKSGCYLCLECNSGMFNDDEVIVPECPTCGNELSALMDDYYCYHCSRSVSKDSAVNGKVSGHDDYDFGEPDYDSMVDNGDSICLNCTYWGVSPHGASYGMVCRRNYPTSGPGDSCSDFVQATHFASYGDEGQYQFNETRMHIQNKLNYWKNRR